MTNLIATFGQKAIPVWETLSPPNVSPSNVSEGTEFTDHANATNLRLHCDERILDWYRSFVQKKVYILEILTS